MEDDSSRAFIELCLTYNPDNRPTAIELLRHPFLCDPPFMSPEGSVDHIAFSDNHKNVKNQQNELLLDEIPSGMDMSIFEVDPNSIVYRDVIKSKKRIAVNIYLLVSGFNPV